MTYKTPTVRRPRLEEISAKLSSLPGTMTVSLRHGGPSSKTKGQVTYSLAWKNK